MKTKLEYKGVTIYSGVFYTLNYRGYVITKRTYIECCELIDSLIIELNN